MAAVREHDDRPEVVGGLHGVLQRLGQVCAGHGIIRRVRRRWRAEGGVFHYMRVFEGFRTVALEQFLHVGRACDDMLGGDFNILRFHGAGAVLQNGNLGFFLRGGGDDPFRLEEQEANEAKDCQAPP